ncbi:hypothetical protein ACJZRZ_003197 [Vibrio parahaemolyticus]|nr:hypothetical protein [Vibrio parahaemolyticus]EJE8673480.1 hypothetical protein [Vibrio parahaemolyticus]
MAMNASTMQSLVEDKLTAAGFEINNEHASTKAFIKAICEAVTEEIQANAKANVTSGSSAGQWPIE